MYESNFSSYEVIHLKIKTIYIKNFGKLKDFRLSLKPGMNIIYGNNEAGKTTVMNFIKMMFYGSNTKSSDISKNPRKKYTPWDGSEMSGFIEFEFQNTSYRLERKFGSSNLSDNISLWNLDTGMNEPISCKYDVGEQFFGLGSSAFEKSVFIGGMSSVINASEKEDEISKRLMNFATSCDETVSYEIVKKRLKKSYEELRSKSGKSGELDKMLVLLSDKTEQLAEAETVEQQKLSDEELCASFCEHLNKKTEYHDKIASAIREQRIIRELHSLETQNRKNAVKDQLKEKLEELNQSITHGRFTVTDEFIDECSNMLSRLDMLKNIYSEKKSEFNTLANEISEMHLAERIQENYVDLDSLSDKKKEIKENIAQSEQELENLHTGLEELQEKLVDTQIKEEKYKEYLADMESHNNSVLINYVMPVAAVFICALALLMKDSWVLINIAPVCGMIFVLAKLLERAKKNKEAKNPELVKQPPDYEKIYADFENMKNEYNEKIKLTKQNLLLLGDEYANTEQKKHELEIYNNKLTTQNEQKIAEQNKLNMSLSSMSSEITTLNINLMTYFANYRSVSNIAQIEDSISHAQSVLSEIEKTKAILSSKYDEDIITDSPEAIQAKMTSLKNKLSTLTGKSGPKLLTDEQLDALENNLEDAKKDIDKVNDEITSLRTKINSQYRMTATPAVIHNEIDEIKSNINAMDLYAESVKAAMEALDEAGNEIRQTFGPKLNSHTQRIFSHLTNGKYSEILVSKNLEINTTEDKSSNIHTWQYLSAGTAEQAYFSLRLAIADMITQNKIPLFLDDVFIQYDPGRAKKGFEFISEYSRLNQVLLFTCHKYEEFSDKYIMFPEN